MASAVDFLQAVQSQLHSDQVLGWFAYRPVSSLQPTNQECLISSSMAAALDSLHVKSHSPHTLFAIVSFLPRHEGSSCDVQQRMFQLSSIRCAQRLSAIHVLYVHCSLWLIRMCVSHLGILGIALMLQSLLVGASETWSDFICTATSEESMAYHCLHAHWV